MESFGPVVVRGTVAAAQHEVWAKLVSTQGADSWWPISVVAEVGGSVSAPAGEVLAERTGTVDVVTDGRTLGWVWRAEDAPSVTTVVLMVRPDESNTEATRITVIETGFAGLDDATAKVAAAEQEWRQALESLAQEFAPEADEPEAVVTDSDEDEGSDAGANNVVDDHVVADADAESNAGVDADEDVETDTEEDAQEPEATGAEESDSDDADGESFIAAVAAEGNEGDEEEGVEVIDAELIEFDEDTFVETTVVDSGDGAILLPEVGQMSASADTTLTASTGLQLDQPIEVEEVSEWELLLRGEQDDE